MLVLSRKLEEEVTIGDDIVVKVVEIDRNVIKLGITAPRHIKVMRPEVLEKSRPLKEGDQK